MGKYVLGSSDRPEQVSGVRKDLDLKANIQSFRGQEKRLHSLVAKCTGNMRLSSVHFRLISCQS
jgi:hypothetical protein